MRQSNQCYSRALALLVPIVLAHAGCSNAIEPEPDAIAQSTQAVQVAESAEAAIMREAEQHLAAYLALIPPGEEQEWGFDNREQFAQAKVGQPYEMFELGSDGTPRPMDVWRVPVLVGDQQKALITVQRERGAYSAISFGATKLAAELGALKAEQTRVRPTDVGHGRSIMRSFARTADFVSYGLDARQPKNHAALKFHPLESAKTGMSAQFERRRKAKTTASSASANDDSAALDIASVRSLLND